MIKWMFVALVRLLLPCLRLFVLFAFKVKVTGMESLVLTGKTVLIPNHVSLLDAVLLALILPKDVAFVVNTNIAKRFAWVLHFRAHITVDPLNPYSVRTMLKTIQSETPLVIFPEGRISTTGGMMKIYGGIGYLALRSQARIVPIAIEGLEYSKFSYLRGKIKQRWFPQVNITFGEAFRVPLGDDRFTRKVQKEHATEAVRNQLLRHLLESRLQPEVNLFNELLSAAHKNGQSTVICVDVLSNSALTYRKLQLTSYTLAVPLGKLLQGRKRVALLLPNAAGHVVTLFALFRLGITPAILNYSAGRQAMLDACETAEVSIVLTSKAFIVKAGLSDFVQAASSCYQLVYLEEVKEALTLVDKLHGLFDFLQRKKGPVGAGQNEVVLFTSGSESKPKGVVLTHRNICANLQQARLVIAFNSSDSVLGSMPMFHSFGLTAGTMLPILSGVKLVLYPNPLHYKVIPELVYDRNITILFGTSTFLGAYARTAHPYDFAHSLRYVVAGAERLKEEVRQIWQDKFGIRILEGYGTTETTPVISLNTPMYTKKGSVGKLLPGMDAVVEEVEGIATGGHLLVRGPNVMKGYLIHSKGFVPASEWYSTGDIVTLDDQGYLFIQARLQSFAKIGGEKVSLLMVEELVSKVLMSPAVCAAVHVPDRRKGERIIVFHTSKVRPHETLRESMRGEGQPAIYMPSEFRYIEKLPLLGSGKIDYVTLKQWALKSGAANIDEDKPTV
ncbi:AMP-binding protein [Paenibacillus qinlingensis]|uniref:Acyl-[acyl-carrier-protein]-phospholipid O-acyltransferase/long-chain-fatty-acid--[acyl-carrier-protein] ligase n=1 Tax=Paenibacillus qinlingensis TaxID=1837343 RepID=A0ABU1P744_9BACL|nr:AMP-binding protein [Paenibacillus qinlingensis]MDR6555379.1 acyl-[acyl-carrier-protein]-phospholipid O-acyltransferase/long-chain-fatty-acid--[acyl-carrier-protein] ligase [Paenibacillus qinlingensis]